MVETPFGAGAHNIGNAGRVADKMKMISKMESSSKAPNSVMVAQALFFLNAAIWSLFGVASLVRIANRNPDHAITVWIIAMLMFGNAGAMLWAGVGIGKQQKRFFYLAVAVLAINIILTVTDQFGLLDLITLIFDLVLLGLLIATRKRYSHPPETMSQLG